LLSNNSPQSSVRGQDGDVLLTPYVP
jgi:hypothetical protein